MQEPIIRQAGAIAVKRGDTGIPLVMIVRAKKNPDHWIFPKGHVEQGESEEAAAERELCEEAGIEGIAVRRAGEEDFRLNNKLYRVAYFLVRYVADAGDGEAGREPRWCTIEEALSLLTFKESQHLLSRMAPFLDLRIAE